jgi:hypothetical protein
MNGRIHGQAQWQAYLTRLCFRRASVDSHLLVAIKAAPLQGGFFRHFPTGYRPPFALRPLRDKLSFEQTVDFVAI